VVQKLGLVNTICPVRILAFELSETISRVTLAKVSNLMNGSLSFVLVGKGRVAMFRLRLVLVAAVSLALLGAFLLPRLEAVARRTNTSKDGSQRTPILVELFTSEGCSDCPPADALLERLDRSQPINGAELIVLSEHVDYWNDIGWRDPYSSREYSQRQGAYGSHFGLGSVYTPQMVIDGRFELVGSDEGRATTAIERAAKTAKIPVDITSIHLEAGNIVTLHVNAGPLPSSVAVESADVLIATADERDESHVSRGENAGKTLKHIAVLRSLTRVGTVGRSGDFSRDVRVNINRENAGNLRVVAIVQAAPVGAVLGVGAARLSN
jgi:hypothetical protein